MLLDWLDRFHVLYDDGDSGGSGEAVSDSDPSGDYDPSEGSEEGTEPSTPAPEPVAAAPAPTQPTSPPVSSQLRDWVGQSLNQWFQPEPQQTPPQPVYQPPYQPPQQPVQEAPLPPEPTDDDWSMNPDRARRMQEERFSAIAERNAAKRAAEIERQLRQEMGQISGGLQQERKMAVAKAIQQNIAGLEANAWGDQGVLATHPLCMKNPKVKAAAEQTIAAMTARAIEACKQGYDSPDTIAAIANPNWIKKVIASTAIDMGMDPFAEAPGVMSMDGAQLVSPSAPKNGASLQLSPEEKRWAKKYGYTEAEMIKSKQAEAQDG